MKCKFVPGPGHWTSLQHVLLAFACSHLSFIRLLCTECLWVQVLLSKMQVEELRNRPASPFSPSVVGFSWNVPWEELLPQEKE